jgi:hypothetical protein
MGLNDELLPQILGEMNEEDENLAYKELQSQMNEKQRNTVLLLITITTRFIVLYGCETWSLILSEERTLMMFRE